MMLVFIFRRDLLRLLGIGEFSLEATFRDPCSSLVLPEVRRLTSYISTLTSPLTPGYFFWFHFGIYCWDNGNSTILLLNISGTGGFAILLLCGYLRFGVSFSYFYLLPSLHRCSLCSSHAPPPVVFVGSLPLF